jgi:8-oxo-dGTP diphosphatase
MSKRDVTCAIIIKDGKILVATRNEYVSNTGLWEFPGGKPKAGESLETCLIRRVKEELSLDIQIVDYLPSYEVEMTPEKTFIMHPFIAEIIGGNTTLIDHNKAEWFEIRQLISIAWPPTDTPIIDMISKRYIKTGKLY